MLKNDKLAMLSRQMGSKLVDVYTLYSFVLIINPLYGVVCLTGPRVNNRVKKAL